MNIRDWTIESRSEPTLRVGVILDEDRRQSVRLLAAGWAYSLLLDDESSAAGHAARRLLPGAALAAEVVEPASGRRGIVIRSDSPGPGLPAPGERLNAGHLRLQKAPPEAVVGPVSGATGADLDGCEYLNPSVGIRVKDVPAGRGFHWQQNLDQTLAGAVELWPGPHGIVLINELPLETYLAGVITSEMSAGCPAEFLKAQCVVARSWLLAMTEPKHRPPSEHERERGAVFDRCNDDCCQRYQGVGELSPSARGAVQSTRGCILLNPEGRVLDANYAKCCGGITEDPVAVWGQPKAGVCPVVDAPPDAAERDFFPVTEKSVHEFLGGSWTAQSRAYCSPSVVPVDSIARYLGRVDRPDNYFRWTVRYARLELEDLVREKLPELGEMTELRGLQVLSRGVSGRANGLQIEWTDRAGAKCRSVVQSEYHIRQVLHPKFLYSSAFAITEERDRAGHLSAVTLRGAGWGHGVGLCQIGALGMALGGSDYQAICRHYYPQARLSTAY